MFLSFYQSLAAIEEKKQKTENEPFSFVGKRLNIKSKDDRRINVVKY